MLKNLQHQIFKEVSPANYQTVYQKSKKITQQMILMKM
ncbi:unnamed protein product [Trichobilharzia regenti]|nr:unnamed protein product [Trichobilharzia regenti]